MQTLNNNENDVKIKNAYSKLSSPTTKLGLNTILLSKKRDVKTLLFSCLGKIKSQRKPSALRKLEIGLQKVFFGCDGIVTNKIPSLKKEYRREQNKVLFIPDKYDIFKLNKNFSDGNIHHINIKNSTKKINGNSINYKSRSSYVDILSCPQNVRKKNNLKYKYPKIKLIKSKNSLCTSYSLKNISLKSQNTTFDTISRKKSRQLSTLPQEKVFEKIEEKLNTFHKTHTKLEKKLFDILDKAEVENKAAIYLKSGTDQDIEDITDKEISKYQKPKKVRSHYLETLKLSEQVGKLDKDLLSERKIKLHKKKNKNIQIILPKFEQKIRKNAEKNYYDIQKKNYNLFLEQKQFFALYENYKIK